MRNVDGNDGKHPVHPAVGSAQFSGSEAMAVLVAGGDDSPLEWGPHGAARILGYVPGGQLADRLNQQLRLDLLWLRGSDVLANADTAAIAGALTRLEAHMVCEMEGAALDAAFDAFAHLDGVQFLSAPTPVERAMALAGARHSAVLQVADSGRDIALERIDRLQDEVARISALLAVMNDAAHAYPVRANDMAAAPVSFSPMVRENARAYRAESDLATFARYPGGDSPSGPVRRMLRQRRMREQFFPADLFADPAWDMLLDLYAAQLEGQPVAVSSLCIAAAVPATTALRWIKTMTDTGLFERQADPRDGRRIFIGLAPEAAQAMERYFSALEASR